MTTTRSILRHATTLGALWLLASAAPAQSIGRYEGTTSQGHPISFDVIDDGAGGNAFGGGGAFWEADCSKSGPGRTVAWGVGTNMPFSGNKVTAEFRFNALYQKWKITFSGSSASGTFLGRTPEFTDVNSSTKRVELCDSGSLSFTATLAPPAEARLAPGQVVKLK